MIGIIFVLAWLEYYYDDLKRTWKSAGLLMGILLLNILIIFAIKFFFGL